MATVNPPPQINIPKEVSGPMRVFFERILMILFQLWRRTGGATDNIESVQANSELVTLARIDDIDQKIGSGDTLTCDDTGFTCDLDHFSCDQDEA